MAFDPAPRPLHAVTRLAAVVCGLALVRLLAQEHAIALTYQASPSTKEALSRFRAAARSGDSGLRAIAAEGITRHRGKSYVCPHRLRFSYPYHYQFAERDMAIPENGPGGWPRVYTITRSGAWTHGVGRGSAPFVPQGRPAPANPAPIVAQREVLKVAVGIVPDWLVDASLVSLGRAETLTRGGETLTAIEVSDAVGPFGRLYFSTRTHLPVTFEYDYITNIPRPTREMVTFHFADFRRVAGALLPFTITREYNGQGNDAMHVTRYDIGGALPDGAFQQPSSDRLDAILPPAAAAARR